MLGSFYSFSSLACAGLNCVHLIDCLFKLPANPDSSQGPSTVCFFVCRILLADIITHCILRYCSANSTQSFWLPDVPAGLIMHRLSKSVYMLWIYYINWPASSLSKQVPSDLLVAISRTKSVWRVLHFHQIHVRHEGEFENILCAANMPEHKIL